jgi:hypothetical protein
LEHDALLILLELLDRAAVPMSETPNYATATSDDGSLVIHVDRDASPQVATIETPAGYLHLADASIAIKWRASIPGDEP